MSDYVLVPKEPTLEMLQSGYLAWRKAYQTQIYGEALADHCYRAMLSAAPPVGLETTAEERAAMCGPTGDNWHQAFGRDFTRLLAQADAARRTMDISTQANLQTASEILDLLSSRLGDAEYAAPGGMVYVGYVEATQLTRAQAQAKVLRNIVANSAHLPRSTEGGT